MEKILLRFNDSDYSRKAELLSEDTRVANEKIIPLIVGLNLKPTEELVKDCINSGNKMRLTYFEQVDKDLKSFSSESIKNNLRRQAEEEYHATSTQLKDFAKSVRRSLNFITVKNGKCTYNEAALRESCNVWLSSDNEIEAYKQHQKLAEALNAFIPPELIDEWKFLFKVKDGKITTNEFTNYKYFAK